MLQKLTLTILLILSLPYSFVFSQAGSTITGRVLNQTTQQEVKADWVVLVKAGQGLQTVKQLDNVSKYEFSAIPILTNAPYLIRAFYKGVLYSQNLMIQEDKTYHVDLRVYDVTERWKDISVRIPHTIIGHTGDQLEIQQSFQVLNDGKLTYISRDAKKPTFRFKTPPGARIAGLTTSFDNSMPLPAEPFEFLDGMGINFPIKPGSSQFQITFTLNYSGNTIDLPMESYYDVGECNIFVSPKDILVSSDKLMPLHDEKLEADDFAAYQSSSLKANEKLAVRLSGGTKRATRMDDDAPIKAMPNTVQKNIFVLMPFLLAVLILFTYFGMNRTSQRNFSKNDWLKQQDSLARQIAELDDTFAKKGISDNAYQKRRLVLKSQLRKVTGKIHSKTP